MKIVFRSRYSHQNPGNSKIYIQNNWNNFRDISPYVWWDSKNIFWKKTLGSSLYQKNFEENSSLSAIIIHVENPWDTFSTFDAPSKQSWKCQSIHTMQYSLGHSGKYETYSIDNLEKILALLMQKKIQKRSIFIFYNESIEAGDKVFLLLKKISTHNEILMISALHPFELRPTSNMLLAMKVFNKKNTDAYLQKLWEAIEHQKKILQSIWIQTVSTVTKFPIEWVLNNYYKYEYKH